MPRRRTVRDPAVEPIRIMVVEPRALLAAGVREVLDREEDIEIVAQVRSAEEALPVVDEAAPDVILVNVPPAESSSADAALQRRLETLGSALVVLGGEDNDASLMGALGMGAVGHVAELAELGELVQTIRRVADGDEPLIDELSGRPDLLDRILDAASEALLADHAPQNPLSSRELDILRLVAAGQRNRQIAETLEISAQTVKNHLTSIMHKLGAPNRTRAVTYAVRHGWLVLEDVPGMTGAAPS
jgi:DNA-binding NarL/FixJ family response regulator